MCPTIRRYPNYYIVTYLPFTASTQSITLESFLVPTLASFGTLRSQASRPNYMLSDVIYLSPTASTQSAPFESLLVRNCRATNLLIRLLEFLTLRGRAVSTHVSSLLETASIYLLYKRVASTNFFIVIKNVN